MKCAKLMILGLAVGLAGCGDTGSTTNNNPTAAENKAKSEATFKALGTFKEVERDVRSRPPAGAIAYLRGECKAGRLGDVLQEGMPKGVEIDGIGVACGLAGRGTKTVPPGQEIQKRVNKSLGKEYKDPSMVAKVLTSGDAASVSAVAILPAFAAAGDKIDVKIQAVDRNVNLESGMLAETDLEEFVEIPGEVKLDPMFIFQGRRASQGVQAYSRGLISLIPDVKDGKMVGQVSASTGYVMGGGMVKDTHGTVLRLKQGNAAQALLVEYTIAAHFHTPVKAIDNSTLTLALPPEYAGNWERFLRVVHELDSGLDPEAARGRADSLIGQLSGDAKGHDRAEYALEGLGNAGVPAMVRAVKTSQGARRQALLRILTQLNVNEIGPDLFAAARSGSETERAESARLIGQLKPQGAVEVLVQLLSDDSGIVRSDAVRGLAELKPKVQVPVIGYFGQDKNFILSSADVPGKAQIVIHTAQGVRRIDVFGKSVTVADGFKGEAGVVQMTVDAGMTNMLIKHRPDLPPIKMPTTDIRDIIYTLDSKAVGVPLNDILLLIGEIDRARSMKALVVWVE